MTHEKYVAIVLAPNVTSTYIWSTPMMSIKLTNIWNKKKLIVSKFLKFGIEIVTMALSSLILKPSKL